MLKNKKSLIIISLILVFIITVSGCTQPQTTANVAKDSDTIKIGAVLILTGGASYLGESSAQGINLAVKEINNAGGINGKKIEVIYEDMVGDSPAKAVGAVQKLNAQGIDIIIGPTWSPAGLAIAPVVCENKILTISDAVGVAGFSEACDYIFNIWPNDYESSKKLGEYAVSEGNKKVAIIGSKQIWEEEQAYAVKEGVLEANGEVVEFILTSRDASADFRTEVTKIMQKNPDAVVFTNMAYQSVTAKRLKEQGYNGDLFTVLIDPSDVQKAEGAFENAITISSFTPTEEYKIKFENNYKRKPTLLTDSSYDIVRLIAEAMKRTGSEDPTILKSYLSRIRKYSGVSGDMTFNEYGGITKTRFLQEVQNDKLVTIGGI